MRFYNRETELKELRRIYEQVQNQARMTIITGRRRVGKTFLALEFAKKHKYLYFFIAKKSEHLLCEEFSKEIELHFKIPVIGEIKLFRDILALLIELARKRRLILIIDEFQEFFYINPTVYSEIQKLWDLNKNKCKLNVIFIGSLYSLMVKIFQDSREPLFGRADRFLLIESFRPNTLREILVDKGKYTTKLFFDYYAIIGGIPRYIDILVANNLFSFEEIIDFMISENSPFIQEGRIILIEEFGKEYAIYFSILELIARGKTSRPEIESILDVITGGYLERLEEDYGVIAKHKPFNAKPGSHLQKYYIYDNFLNFWFRFIYRNYSAIEIGNYKYLRELIKRDYATYAGSMLEKLYREIFAFSGNYNKLGSYWEKANQNQIDLVAVNDLEKRLVLAEVKQNKDKISIPILKAKAEKLIRDYHGYHIEYLSLSPHEIDQYLGKQ